MFAWWLWDSADPDFFIAHADITLIQALPRDDTSLHDELTPFHGMLELFRTMPKATIAIIEGIARGGGTQRLPRLVGRARALEVVLGCQDIDAATAEAWVTSAARCRRTNCGRSSTRLRPGSRRSRSTSSPRPSAPSTPAARPAR